MTVNRIFPEGFLWGSATAAYQVEGSSTADGAGMSIWDRFAHTPGMIFGGDTGDTACDQYRLYRDDVKLMAELGLKAYRFSTSWSRVLPTGRGQVNPAGLDYYDRLIDTLLENGVEPLLTLYHWDMPAALEDCGGWLNPEVSDWFSDYASLMYRKFDGRVKTWATLNEPWVITDGGYLHGALAPGHKSPYEAPIASHHLLRSHGAAVKAYRALGKHRIGIVVNIEPKYPASQSPEDLAAVARADAYMNRQYLDPVFFGRYPDEMSEVFGASWPAPWAAADFELISQPIDWLGVNYYTRSVTQQKEASWPVRAGAVRQVGATYTETGWEVFPQGLTDTLTWVKGRYGDIPLMITENGAAFYDPPVAEDGRVQDPLRVAYLRKHISAVHEAIQQGVNVEGYMVWSLLDNLEWSLGYSKRFGIVHVNFETQARTCKDSAKFYARVVATNGGALAESIGG